MGQEAPQIMNNRMTNIEVLEWDEKKQACSKVLEFVSF
jgi:uncharacterized protein with FMN-binding domain